MIYTTIEWFALVIIVASLIKIAFILIKPKAWMNFAAKLWRKPKVTGTISLILSAVVLYYLLTEINIVQIFAVLLFFSLFMMAGHSPDIKDLIVITRKNMKKIIKESRLYILIWLLLIIWVLWEIFTNSKAF